MSETILISPLQGSNEFHSNFFQGRCPGYYISRLQREDGSSCDRSLFEFVLMQTVAFHLNVKLAHQQKCRDLHRGIRGWLDRSA
jgi:hypothetical protein